MHKKILLLPGDGIGSEVLNEAVKVLKKIGKKFKHKFEFKNGLIGGVAIDETGKALPDETLKKAQNSDAILFGAVGDPKFDNPSIKIRPEQGLLKIRKELSLYTNIRPIKLFDALLSSSSLKEEVIKGSDFMFFRELTGGIYFGEPRKRIKNGTKAIDTMIYTKAEIERIAHQAFQAAQKRKNLVTSVEKSNVLECSRLWKETVIQVAEDYPDVTLEHQLVDSMAMKLIAQPTKFDIILTGNMFGDILSDMSSEIAGSLGMLASASMGDTIGLYEPIHGSAPDIAGKNIANPIATILSVQMMLSLSFDLINEAKSIENAVNKVLSQGYRTFDIKDNSTPDKKILGTKEMGDLIASNI